MNLNLNVQIPSLLPVLPVRNTVLFPNTAIPLIVGRTKSLLSVQAAEKNEHLILVIAQLNGASEDPATKELYSTGVVCQISQITSVEKNGSYQLVANGLVRFKVTEYSEVNGCLYAKGEILKPPTIENELKVKQLSHEVKQLGKVLLGLTAAPNVDNLQKLLSQLQDPIELSDLCCTFLHLPIAQKQELLEIELLEDRMHRLLEYMIRERDRLVLANEIQGKLMERLSKEQRDQMLREQIRTIHDELGEERNILEEFATKIETIGLLPDAKKVAKEELARLRTISRSSPEYHVIRSYLEILFSLPWKSETSQNTETIDIQAAKTILDRDHYGLPKVKERILEYLAVAKLKKSPKGPILCLVGPPGVGKTSIVQSIATALGRQFSRTSLGGVRDEAEIRGHRKTYIGAMPGRIIQAIRRVGTKDPVMLLDEIDKLGSDFRGDPASALLEVLDPEQNSTYTDHYLDVPYDLSQVFFITTANTRDTIPPALRDRMEFIEMGSYSRDEKVEIARKYLVPKVLEENGLTAQSIELPLKQLSLIIEHYTFEAGVRELQRKLSAIARWTAKQIAMEQQPIGTPFSLSAKKIEEILGPQKYFEEQSDAQPKIGVVTGLAWTPNGGQILNVEVARMEGKGSLILTGQLGEVMKESAQIALSLVRSLKGKEFPFKQDKTDFHIHVPAGAIPKDGPSAGLAIFLALSSLTEEKAVRSKLAVTGEVTLQGRVMAVGGIREKVLAAHRAGIHNILLPARNEGDLVEIKESIRKEITFYFVKEVSEALSIAGLGNDPRSELPPNPVVFHQSELPMTSN